MIGQRSVTTEGLVFYYPTSHTTTPHTLTHHTHNNKKCCGAQNEHTTR